MENCFENSKAFFKYYYYYVLELLLLCIGILENYAIYNIFSRFII